MLSQYRFKVKISFFQRILTLNSISCTASICMAGNSIPCTRSCIVTLLIRATMVNQLHFVRQLQHARAGRAGIGGPSAHERLTLRSREASNTGPSIFEQVSWRRAEVLTIDIHIYDEGGHTAPHERRQMLCHAYTHSVRGGFPSQNSWKKRKFYFAPGLCKQKLHVWSCVYHSR